MFNTYVYILNLVGWHVRPTVANESFAGRAAPRQAAAAATAADILVAPSPIFFHRRIVADADAADKWSAASRRFDKPIPHHDVLINHYFVYACLAFVNQG